MRFMARTYEDATTKPHIDEETFKYDITCREDIEEAVEGLKEFLEDRFTSWEDLQDDREDIG